MGFAPTTSRVLVVFGTRPEGIKLASLIARMRENPLFDCRVCVTGQHREMLDQVLDLFQLKPKYDLRIMRPGQTLSSITCRVLEGVDALLASERFDLVVVHGDTTSSFAASLAAFHRRVPVAHLEAGLRTGSLANPYPEEANRRLTAVLARWHLAPTNAARENLLREGVRGDHIDVTGNTVVDSLAALVSRIMGESSVRENLERQFGWLASARDEGRKVILVSCHRRENWGAPLGRVCKALRSLARRPDTVIAFPVHLNPIIGAQVHSELAHERNIRLLEPQGYLEFVYLMMQSHLIYALGGIQEEAPTLGKPVLVLRDLTERQEAVAAGTAYVVGTRVSAIVAAVAKLLEDARLYERMGSARNPFGDGRASERAVAALVRWLGDPGGREASADEAAEAPLVRPAHQGVGITREGSTARGPGP